MRIVVATKQKIAGSQRKLAWFSFQGSALYYEMAGDLEGSHTSYHKDGTLFRTSPATKVRTNLVGKHMPLSHFKGLYKLGMGMVLKTSFGDTDTPMLKSKDRKGQVYEIDVDHFPSDTLNLVAELLEPNRLDLISAGSQCVLH